LDNRAPPIGELIRAAIPEIVKQNPMRAPISVTSRDNIANMGESNDIYAPENKPNRTEKETNPATFLTASKQKTRVKDTVALAIIILNTPIDVAKKPPSIRPTELAPFKIASVENARFVSTPRETASSWRKKNGNRYPQSKRNDPNIAHI